MTSDLEFLSPGLAEADYRSPLAGKAVRDLSALGKVEVRGEVDAVDGGEIVQITPRRALILCDPAETVPLLRRLRDRHAHAVDVTAAYAALAVDGERVMRRLTDLDLDALPAVGAVAGVPALVLRTGDEFRLVFAQEYSSDVGDVVVDALAGLA